ncbi:MAG TPA: response regulator [Vicinamibacterales bacterium]|jgi:CheY-like chemotaxis protein
MTPTPILIVDDNALNAKLTKLLLGKCGYDVKTAAHAREALAILQHFTPALILMDLQLPGIDGFELTRRLKLEPALAGTVIVALTAYAMKGDEQRAIEAGFDGYVTKPIDTRTLPTVVSEYLAKRRSASA